LDGHFGNLSFVHELDKIAENHLFAGRPGLVEEMVHHDEDQADDQPEGYIFL